MSVFVQKRLSRMFWMLGDQGLHSPCVPALWLTSALPNGGLECSRLAVVGEPSERGNAILKICNATCNAQPPALELSHQTTSCPGCTSSTLVQSIDPIRWSCRPRRTACSVMPQQASTGGPAPLALAGRALWSRPRAWCRICLFFSSPFPFHNFWSTN